MSSPQMTRMFGWSGFAALATVLLLVAVGVTRNRHHHRLGRRKLPVILGRHRRDGGRALYRVRKLQSHSNQPGEAWKTCERDERQRLREQQVQPTQLAAHG